MNKRAENRQRGASDKNLTQGQILDELAVRLGVPFWGKLLIWILISGLVPSGGYVWWRFNSLDKEMQAIRAEQASLNQELIKRLLDKALADATAGRRLQALQASELAGTVLTLARERKQPAQPEFFQAVVDTVNRLNIIAVEQRELSTGVFTVSSALVAYRSALEPPPKLGSPTLKIEKPSANLIGVPLEEYAVIDCSSVLPGYYCISNEPPRLFSEQSGFSGIAIKNGRILLDGLYWREVVFVNSDIYYEGGEVFLQHARFVNCTFVISQTDRGLELANSIALRQPTFSVAQRRTSRLIAPPALASRKSSS